VIGPLCAFTGRLRPARRTRKVARQPGALPRLPHRGITPADRLYEINGLQFQPFNTTFQLMTEPLLPQASQLLLIPDLLPYSLTDGRGAE
jgi:hypothetical protein